jgi:hypothetical protein
MAGQANQFEAAHNDDDDDGGDYYYYYYYSVLVRPAATDRLETLKLDPPTAGRHSTDNNRRAAHTIALWSRARRLLNTPGGEGEEKPSVTATRRDARRWFPPTADRLMSRTRRVGCTIQ